MSFLRDEEKRLGKAKTDYFNHVESIVKRDIHDATQAKDMISNAEQELKLVVTEELDK